MSKAMLNMKHDEPLGLYSYLLLACGIDPDETRSGPLVLFLPVALRVSV